MQAQSTGLSARSGAISAPAQGFALRPLSAWPEPAASADEAGERIARWVRGYLMRPHPDLGRPGVVCPYTPIAGRLDLVRIGVSVARDEGAALAVMRQAVAAFDALAAPPAHQPFRAVLVGFPHCGGAEGRAMLKRVQNRLRPESIWRGRMIGLFDPQAPDPGLLNPDFRPFRAPVPLLAIRSLVEADAPFVLRNPRLLPIYLFKFLSGGPGRLTRLLWR